jgi:hypothetical protein
MRTWGKHKILVVEAHRMRPCGIPRLDGRIISKWMSEKVVKI